MDTKVNSQGYEVLTQVSRYSRQIWYHVLIVEYFFGGSIPRGNVIHHIDENRLNNETWNLMVCSREQHPIIHKRLKAEKECGNADWRRCNYCKQYDDPKNLYLSGTGGYHRVCSAKYNRDFLSIPANRERQKKGQRERYWSRK